MHPLSFTQSFYALLILISFANAWLFPSFGRHHQASSSRTLPKSNPTSNIQCSPLTSSFPPSAVSSHSSNTESPFVAISPSGSYRADGTGLHLFLDRPTGQVQTANGTNNLLGKGATINSTFTMQQGKVSFVLSASNVPGVVTAAILIADEYEGDEIDLEFTGSDPSHWQTNVFATSPQDTEPLYGTLGSVENVPPSSSTGGHPTIAQSHTYTIDWNPERIIWSVDGKAARRLTPKESRVKNIIHYPTAPLRIQLGIWDASSPIGTAQWAGGPINWPSVSSRITATIHSVSVEC